MPNLPDKDAVRSYVKGEIAEYTNLPKSQITDSKKLKDDLNMDNTSLNFLTMVLRAYVKSKNSGATLKAKEVKKKNLKVSGLIDLVFNKIHEIG